MEKVLTKRISEKKLFTCTEMLRAVAHPARMAIIDLLGIRGQMSVTEIFTALEMEQAAVSHQLGILRKNNLLEFRKEGKKMIYRLTRPELIQIIRCIEKCAL